MRGNKGADFESEAFVTRGKPIGLFSCFGFGRRSKKVYLLIKGPHIFVFANESASAPNYAIPLKHERVEVMDVKGDSQMVTLESSLGDVLYEFKFDLKENRELANNFGRVLEEQIAVGNVDEVKERLGHGRGNNSKSLAYAKAIGDKKEKEQPEETTNNDIDLGNYAYLQSY